ncbi:hypothetical protein BDP27DRAFT_1420465 [Rhodocollybia butyracea]|uniref:Uncharacterized protein n=1 Tax=Rhodocollybia butyracea TaxID=206335 RepID=A0A9P5PVF6_9AGAR|nr:hypothetical protein BDP27DRAFT_1420465 [Rhodocollybia butyracea]
MLPENFHNHPSPLNNSPVHSWGTGSPLDSSPNDANPLSLNSFHLPDRSPSPFSLSNQELPNTTPLIRPGLVDNLANDFGLNEQQCSTLHAYVQFGSVEGGIGKAEMLAKLYAMTVNFDLYNHPKIIEDENNVETLRRMLRDLDVRLQTTFAVMASQTKTIRAVVTDLIYNPMRTCYHELAADVFESLRKNAQQYHFHNVFRVTGYEKTLETTIVKQCSSVRNNFRQHLQDGMAASADEFTHKLNKKYLRLGGPKYSLEQLLNKNIILRNYIHENPSSIWAKEEEGDESDTDESLAVVEDGRKKKKRKLKTHGGGKVPKGCDFWGLIDQWFKEQLDEKELGKKMSDPRWKQKIEGFRRLDEAGFKNLASPSNTTTPAQSPALRTGTSPPTNTIHPTNRLLSGQPVGNGAQLGQGMQALAYIR